MYVNNELSANRRIHFKANLILITFIRGLEEMHENLIIVRMRIITWFYKVVIGKN
jgi:hypothetical protein